jgi:dTMP kinase
VPWLVLHAAAKRGVFILFEGVDRCGKTTQAARLAENLRRTGPVEEMRFPGLPPASQSP